VMVVFTQCTKDELSKSTVNESAALSAKQDVSSQTFVENGTADKKHQNNSSTTTNPWLYNCITLLPVETISNSEISALTIMREEELLAHDIYVKMFAAWHIPVFNNISASENQHTEAIKLLMDKYSLTDVAQNHLLGVFVNQDIQNLYDALLTQGSASLNAALAVGATIEDLDIKDLQDHSALDVDNQDILFVFSELQKGSRNHLRSFNAQLVARGLSYQPQYITQVYFDQIVTSPHEIGPVVCPQ
jgi:hypothetical protein